MACFDSLVFWCIGYGGWAGVALIPLMMLYTDSFAVRAMSIVLAPCVGALVAVSTVTITYTVSLLAHSVLSVMINPAFMNTLCASIPLSTSAVSLYLVTNYIRAQEMKDEKDKKDKNKEGAETDEENNETSEESDQSDQSDQESDQTDQESDQTDQSDQDNNTEEDDEEDDEETENKTVSDAESTDISEPDQEPDHAWRNEANFDGLRNAPPIPDIPDQE
jgi:hypothetical protein